MQGKVFLIGRLLPSGLWKSHVTLSWSIKLLQRSLYYANWELYVLFALFSCCLENLFFIFHLWELHCNMFLDNLVELNLTSDHWLSCTWIIVASSGFGEFSFPMTLNKFSIPLVFFSPSWTSTNYFCISAISNFL